MSTIPESSLLEKRGQDQETILIVDDERLMLHLLEKVLTRHGYQVLTACDGEQAIEVYRSYKPRIDAVLLDVGLPRSTGWQVLLKLKEEKPDVRVVIASGYLEPKMKAEMSGAGVKHFVNKPYKLNELLQTIQGLLRSS
jgi:DNA-binding response OmpR family regulator